MKFNGEKLEKETGRTLEKKSATGLSTFAQREFDFYLYQTDRM